MLGRALLVVGLVLVSCGTTSAGSAAVQNGAPDRHEAAATAAPAPARVAALTMRTTDGKDVAIPTAGHPTIVYFMAAWCVSCVQGAVNLAQIYQDYGNRGLQVIAIDVDTGETTADLDRFRSLAGNPRYFWAMDEGQRATRAYAVRSLDATILVSGSGEILFRSESLPDPNTVRRAVQRVLGL